MAAKCPEVVPELRAEIQTALDKHGGVWSAQALFSMKLLDSVMKESQRFNPNLMITPRKILKPIEFRDGTRIPAGVNVCLAGYAALQDGDFYKDPATFDPYRFLKLRTGETEDPLQYASTEVRFDSRDGLFFFFFLFPFSTVADHASSNTNTCP